MIHRTRAVLPLAVLALAGPPAVEAQFLGPWLPPARSVSAKLSAAYSDNTDWFCGESKSHCEPGERSACEPPGERRSRADFLLSAAYVWHGYWELWSELPLAGRNTPADPLFGVAYSRTLAAPG
jgi:hypothetical protein